MSFLHTYYTRVARGKTAANNAVDNANIEALRRVLAVSALGAGTGAAAAGLTNIGTLFGKPQAMLPVAEPVTVRLVDEPATPTHPWHGLRPTRPLPWITAPGQRTKVGGVSDPGGDGYFAPAAQKLYDHVLKPLGVNHAMDIPGLPSTTAASKWWAGPAQMGGAALAGVGAYTAVDWLMKRRRDAAMERELQGAESDYLTAMRQLSAAGRPRAPVGKIAESSVEPFSSWIAQTASNWLNQVPATWTTVATIPALGAGYGMFHMMRDAGDRKALSEALALRRRVRQYAAPPPIQVVPA